MILESWQNLINQTTAADGSDLPEGLDGNTPSKDRRANFAKQLYTQVATAYPTVVMAYELSNHKQLVSKYQHLQLLPRIVDRDEKFDFASIRVDAYVREHRQALGIPKEEQEAVKQDLKRVQRLYRLKPDLSFVSRLLQDHDDQEQDKKLDSATAILHRGKSRFVSEYGKEDALGTETAIAVYRQAEKTLARAFGIYAHFSETINTSPLLPAIAVKGSTELKGVPNYPTLFNSLDGCDIKSLWICCTLITPLPLVFLVTLSPLSPHQ